MQITGIISEYNPFHNGHKYLIDTHRANLLNTADTDNYCIAVMSGNFTQRGEAASLNKWQRAELAVHGGIDLVLELPFVFAVNSAQYFAQGAVSLLQRLNCVDTLCFGSEYTDTAKLQTIAKATASDSFAVHLKKYLQSGLSYAASTAKALSELTCCDEQMLKAPNTILGLEYLKACYKYNAGFQIDIIKRIHADHNEQTLSSKRHFASGTAIRSFLYGTDTTVNTSEFSQLKQFIPPQTFTMLTKQRESLPRQELLSLPLLTKLRLAKLNDVAAIYGMREGIEHKLLAASLTAASMQELLRQLKTKRYPLTKLQRLLLYFLLDLQQAQGKKLTAQGALYARVLAFNEKGTQLLKRLKNCSSIPIITKTSQYLNSKKRCQPQTELTTLEEMLSLDTYATDLYNMCFTIPKRSGADFLTAPSYIKKLTAKNADFAVSNGCSAAVPNRLY